MSEMRSVETTASDIETAIQLGLDQLGVSRESVIVDILDEPSRGLLGIGAKQARVRLTTAAPSRHDVPAAPEPVARPDEQHRAPRQSAAPEPAINAPEANAYGASAPEAEAESSAPSSYDAPTAGEDDLDDDARVGRATLQELLDKMQIQAEVTIHRAPAAPDEDAPWVLQIRGNDLGTLIGRRGETLAALQYITRLIASRDLQRRANMVLDVEGYKTRREEMLRKLAGRMAEQAVQIGRTVTMEPMSPYERRIVHLALRDHPEVFTESVGEGEHRKVTIIPRNA